MSDILVHAEAGVTTLTLNRLERKNSITAAMYEAMADALNAARLDAASRVVVIQGHETVFSAGNDLREFLDAPPVFDSQAPLFQFLNAISTFPKPLVAAVSGAAVGIGCTMLFHCDLVYAGDNAELTMPFVNLGICPEAGSTLLAPQMFGWHRAAEALMLGEPITADMALQIGLVNRVAPRQEVNQLAQEQARKLAAKPASVLATTKRLMKQGQQAQLAAQIQLEGETFSRMLREPAAREAVSAFMEKRKPDFSAM